MTSNGVFYDFGCIMETFFVSNIQIKAYFLTEKAVKITCDVS